MNNLSKTLLFFCAFLWNNLHGQNAVLTGTVTDATTAEPLIAVNIKVGDNGTITDFDGTYSLSLAPGEYEIEFRYVGFENQSETVRLEAGERKVLDISLLEGSHILDMATVTSGKFEKALSEVTVSMEVLKPSLIYNTNKTSVADVLDKVPGVNLVGSQANIRGGSGFSYGAGSRVLLLVDDMPILQADAGFPQWADVPTENIEQIEVVKGAASALYGSAALNGIINVRTAYAKSKPETNISPFYTYYLKPKDKYKAWWKETGEQPFGAGGSISHRRKMGKLDLVTGGYFLKRNSVQDSSGTTRGRVNLNLRYRLTDRLSVGLNTNYNRTKGSSFFFWADADTMIYRPGVAMSNSNNTRYNIDPFVTYFDQGGNRHKIQGRFYNVKNNTGSNEADQSNRSEVYYGEYQFQRRFESLSLVATGGMVFQTSVASGALYVNRTITSRNTAGYIQFDKKFGERLNFSAGFRYEQNTILAPDTIIYRINEQDSLTVVTSGGKIEESKPVFRFGANYQAGKRTYLRASLGQGYRFPTIAEKYLFTVFSGIPVNPNPALESETGWTTELGIKQGFRISNFDGYLDLAGFWSEYNNMMEFNFLGFGNFPGFQSQNIGNTIIRGGEITLAGRGAIFGLETTLLAGYTFLDPKFKEFDFFAEVGSEASLNAQNSSICFAPNDSEREKCENILKYRYKHTFKIDIESKWKNLSFGIGVIYNSHMLNIDKIFELLVVPGLPQYRYPNYDPNSDEIPEPRGGDTRFDTRLAYRLTDFAKLSFIVDNLFNAETSSRPGQLRPTRNMTLRADFQF